MNRISLFLCLLNFSIFIYTSDVPAPSVFSRISQKLTSEELQSHLADYSRFHKITKDETRSKRLEIASALVARDTKSCIDCMRVFSTARSDLQSIGVEIADDSGFQSIQNEVDLNRRAVKFSRTLLLDVIFFERFDNASRVEPSDQDLKGSMDRLIARPDSPESERSIELLWEKKESIELTESIYKISSIHPLPRKESGCGVM